MFVYVVYNLVSFKVELDKLQKLQNRALRIANLAPRYTSNIELHRYYKIVPLYMRRERNLLKLLHTYLLHNLDYMEFQWDGSMCGSKDSQDSRITRQMSAPYVPLQNPKSTKYKISCAFKGPWLWLELPLSFRREADQLKFKQLLKIKSLSHLETLNSV